MYEHLAQHRKPKQSYVKRVRPAGVGFTLIELLLVIGIIAILASVVIIAVNPRKQLGNANDAQRMSDVRTILDAIDQYGVDNNGAFPGNIPTGIAQEICRTGAANCTGLVDLNALVPAYLVSVPTDPQAGTGSGTRYFVVQEVGERVTVSAPNAQQRSSILVTR